MMTGFIKEDKYILQKNVTSFFIKNNILSEDVQQSYTIFI